MITWPLYTAKNERNNIDRGAQGLCSVEGLMTERIVEWQEIEMMVRKVMLDIERQGAKNRVEELKTYTVRMRLVRWIGLHYF
ncbi:hypothetical protein Ddye_013736 [Dipteronia dyeriana]|uniref:Uncharacterized protein n=1 Tax=Dipteronia dyeriana TaxID=168575 RepID=A0AAD9X6R0_9ROSI|nr:hypothetical protein Ddye_013736 [Dipteronia dyeriana]